MKSFNELYNLFDENLPENAGELFYMLSQNYELRLQFKEAYKLKSAAAKIPHLIPDKSLKSDLLYKLCIAEQREITNKKIFIFGSIIKYGMTSMLSILITILLMSQFQKTDMNLKFDNSSAKNKLIENTITSFNHPTIANTTIKKITKSFQNYSNVKGLENNSKINNKFKNEKLSNQKLSTFLIKNDLKNENLYHVIKNLEKNNPNDFNSETIEYKENSIKDEFPFINIIESQINLIKNDNLETISKFVLPSQNIESNNGSDFIQSMEIKNRNFVLNFKIITDRHSSTPTIPPASFQDFNNVLFKLNYFLVDWFAVGLEYRRENFFQRYMGIGEDGLKYEYDQQPNFNTFSANVQVTPVEVMNFNPILDLTMGINNAGYVARGGISLNYDLRKDIGISAGVEYSKFIYHHQSTKFESEKASFLIGINYNF